MARYKNFIGGAIWLSIAALFLISSLRLGIGEYHNPGPGFFPFFTALFIVILTLVMLWSNLFKKEPAAVGQETGLGGNIGWRQNATAVAALIAYCLVLTKLGYILSTLGLMMILFYSGRMKFVKALLYSLLVVLLSYCLFYFGLKTPLPRGIWGF